MKTLSRRRFVQNSVVAAAGIGTFPSIVGASALGLDGKVAANSRINVGFIGVGPQGRRVMSGSLRHEGARVVALCDIAKRNLELARQQVNERYQNSDCATYHDYRELLAAPGIDVVLIATPDHWHAAVALAAVRAGKDIYLEKPMALSVTEDQLLRTAVQKKQRVFQFGTQQRSSREFRRAVELVRNGRIGNLKQINVWCSGSQPGGPTAPAPVPDGLDYDRWLGPAPYTPYTIDKCFDDVTPTSWKTWWHTYDYALGFIAGWGIHPLDIAYWGHPTMLEGTLEVEGKAVIPTTGACNTPVAWEVNFAFADGARMTYKATRNGCDPCALNDFAVWQQRYGKFSDHGTAFEGTEGWVMVHRGGLHASDDGLLEGPTGHYRLPESSSHVGNFFDAIKTRGKTICPIEEAVQADILCHLSDIAVRLNRPLKWDAAKERFVSDDEANRRLAARPTREGWRLS